MTATIDVASKAGPSTSELAKRAQNGDESAVPALREAMKKLPGFANFVGNLSTRIQDGVLSGVAGTNYLFRESVPIKMDELRKELSGDNPTALERLLVDRIVLCWLVLHVAEMRLASAKGLPLRQEECLHRHIDSCNRRYLSSIRTLAAVRKLAVPVVQLNIGNKQVNVAGAVPNHDRGHCNER